MIRVFKNSILKIFLVLTLSVEALAFHISMTSFERRVDTGGYMEYTLKNSSNKTIRYKFEIQESDIGEDMSKWVEVYPKVMSIPPMQERVLKVYAQSPVGAKKGEYSFKIMITPLSVPTIADSDGAIRVNSTMDFIPIIYFYGHVGDPKLSENLSIVQGKFTNNSQTGRLHYNVTFENKSYTGADLGIKFISNTGSVMFGKWLGRVKKNSKTDFSIELPKEIKKGSEVKKIVLYDAVSLEDIKVIDIN